MTDDEKRRPAPKERRVTPLVVITSFLGLVEVVLGYAVTNTSGWVQVTLLTFAIALTLGIVAAFFVVLWCRPGHMFAPGEYTLPVSPTEYADATRMKKRREISFIQEKKILENNPRAQFDEFLSENVANDLSQPISPRVVENQFWSVVLHALNNHLQQKPLQRDNRRGLSQSIAPLLRGDEAAASALVDLLVNRGYLDSPSPDRFTITNAGYNIIGRQI